MLTQNQNRSGSSIPPITTAKKFRRAVGSCGIGSPAASSLAFMATVGLANPSSPSNCSLLARVIEDAIECLILLLDEIDGDDDLEEEPDLELDHDQEEDYEREPDDNGLADYDGAFEQYGDRPSGHSSSLDHFEHME
jgi:hypothetical protein